MAACARSVRTRHYCRAHHASAFLSAPVPRPALGPCRKRPTTCTASEHTATAARLQLRAIGERDGRRDGGTDGGGSRDLHGGAAPKRVAAIRATSANIAALISNTQPVEHLAYQLYSRLYSLVYRPLHRPSRSEEAASTYGIGYTANETWRARLYRRYTTVKFSHIR